MSTDTQEEPRLIDLLNPIEALLVEMEGLLEPLNTASLKKSHKSVFISFTRMLDYIDDIDRPKQEEIGILIQAYRGMAKKFYTQYELSLLREVCEQRAIYDQAGLAIGRLQDLRMADANDEELERATQILQKSRDDAYAEYRNLVKNYPALMQSALDKLRDEWQRLNAIVTASAALTEDEALIRTLAAVAMAAAISVQAETAQILIVPGNAFALYFFSYVENLAVLTVPIYSVRASWEWSIFWHELAGYKVRQLENDMAINEVQRKLTEFHKGYQKMGQNKKRELLEGVLGYDRKSKSGGSGRKNQFSLNYLTEVFSVDPPNLKDFGGFEHQFEQVLAKATKRKGFQYYEQIKAEGWCVDWFKELYEDACSVMAIGKPFLTFFEDILSRHATADKRHPPPPVRMSVAKELLRLMDPEGEIENKPTSMERATSEQILKFMSLLLAASPLFDSTAVGKSQSFDYNRIKEKLFLYSLPRIVGEKIGTSIQSWEANLLEANSPTYAGRLAAEVLVKEFSIQELANFTKFSSAELASFIDYIKKENQIKPSYENLPAESSYRQLIALSFYERDFFSSKGITRVFYNMNGIPSPAAKFDDTQDTDFIIDNFGLLVRTVISTADGEVTFDFNMQKWATTRSNWNNAFPANSPFPNIRKYNIA